MSIMVCAPEPVLEWALDELAARQRANTNNLANVIKGLARGYVNGSKAAQDHVDTLEGA